MTDKDYVLANRKWLRARSLLSYLQAGFSIVALLVVGSFILLAGSVIPKLPESTRVKPGEYTAFSQESFNSNIKSLYPILTTVATVMIVVLIAQIVISGYMGMQFKKIATETDKISPKSNDGLRTAQAEYSNFFRVYGWLSLATSASIIIIFFIVLGTVISFLGNEFKVYDTLDSKSNNYNFDLNSNSSSSSPNNTNQYDY